MRLSVLNKNYQLTDNGIMIISKILAINTKLICTNSVVNLVVGFIHRQSGSESDNHAASDGLITS